MLSLLLLAAAAPGPTATDLLPKETGAPGCVLDVRRDGQIVETEATGLANLEDLAPNRLDTVFEAGSVSKQFIGAGIAILAEQGRLKLDDPIAKWLPELPPLYRGITIAMLLYHTSGIRSWNNLAELTGRGEDSSGYDNGWVLRTIAKQRQLNNAPGSEYLYSNSNFVLAAIIIERASGRPLNVFYSEALFQRLGMTRTVWRTNFRAIVPGRAQAYLPDENGSWQLDTPLNGVAGAGGLMTTAGDLQRWAAVLASPSSQDRAWVAQLLRPGQLSDGTSLAYGLGIELGPITGIPAYSHAGSTGSYRAWFGVIPEKHLSIALLCNSGGVNTEDLGPEIASRFLPPQASAPTAHHTILPPPLDLAGYYRNPANDAAVEATIDSMGLHFNGGSGFGLDAADRLATADGRRTVLVRRMRDARVAALTVSRIGNAPTILEPVLRWTPTRSELQAFTGSYRSLEIEGTQRIEMDGDRLVWRDPSGISHPLVATYLNTFEAPDASWTLGFISSGQANFELRMSITRARRITFRRPMRDGSLSMNE